MENIKQRSLAELEELYEKKLRHWTERRLERLQQVQACEAQMAAYDLKLRHIRALVGGPQAAAEAPPSVATAATATAATATTSTVKRRTTRRRKSPIRDAALLVLRNRPGEKLTAAQIKTAIRKDTNKRCTRQTINNAVNALEDDGLLQRGKAPKGSGAQFVYWAA